MNTANYVLASLLASVCLIHLVGADKECPANWRIGGYQFCKVPLPDGTWPLTDVITATCEKEGMLPSCNGPVGCQYNWPGHCMVSTITPNCGNGTLSSIMEKICNTERLTHYIKAGDNVQNIYGNCHLQFDKVFGANYGWPMPCGVQDGIYCPVNLKFDWLNDRYKSDVRTNKIFAFCGRVIG